MQSSLSRPIRYSAKDLESFEIELLFKRENLKLKYKKHSLLPLQIQKVACGLFGISDDYIEKYISLDDKLIKDRAATFLFRASGQSMEPTIFKNDILIVDRSIEPVSNQVVVFSFNGEILCKRIVIGSYNTVFVSDNKLFKSLIPVEGSDVSLFGVVTAVITENP